MQLTVNDPAIMSKVETIPKREADRIAIIGCSASRAEAPWNEPGREFWGVNNLIAHELDKPWTRWFEIHYLHKDEIGQWMRRYQYDFRGQKCPDYVAMLAGVKNGRRRAAALRKSDKAGGALATVGDAVQAGAARRDGSRTAVPDT